ncbi:MAG: N-acetylmuramoyl-L-alanine amidase [Verrucomicrobia bacterium]|nr:N-acetylmuramoyl-L-alanine amidase [Verrucomicrobiota bacterium]
MKVSRSTASLIIALNAAAVVVVLVIVMQWPRHVVVPTEQPPAELEIRERIGLLAPDPDWSELEVYQETITREDFESLLTDVFSAGDTWKAAVRIGDSHADVDTQDGKGFRLRFATQPSVKPPMRYWRSASELPTVDGDSDRPLKGMRIAIDPGHIGGKWAQAEERWYSIEKGTEVMEGTMTLQVAKLLKPQLEKMGAQVFLTREQTEPVTNMRPADFEAAAADYLRSIGKNPQQDQRSLEFERDKMFYRTQEIRTRAWLVNDIYKPDLVLCLHFNAESWGNPHKPQFVDRNHLHLIVNGTYSLSEMRLHDQVFDMMQRILQRTHEEETAVSTAVAESMAEATELPAFRYGDNNAQQIGESEFVWARNLLANRLYDCPTVFLEPYVMNHREVHDRVRVGDYEGTRSIHGKRLKSIFREYADGVAEGVRAYYLRQRARK